MRPLELKIKGINSFKEEVVIDFEKLTEYGLFGIFGPTGSGKTTILDGITLALYGETARKNANCIHTGLDTAGVTFRFEMKGVNAGIYVAERAFRRDKKSGNRRSGKCCLYNSGSENGADKTVLADSPEEMNRRCRELIGMDYEDFSRTVVLPQGKFNEFLSLSGREKNQMLQRLFGLEEYGDFLIQKIHDREFQEKEKLDRFIGEFQSYGEVSGETIRKKKTERDTILAAREKTEAQYHQAACVLKEREEIWKLLMEKQKNQTEIRKLVEQKEQMDLLDWRLNASEKAQFVIPFVQAFENAQMEHEKILISRTQAEEKRLEEKKRFVQWSKCFSVICREALQNTKAMIREQQKEQEVLEKGCAEAREKKLRYQKMVEEETVENTFRQNVQKGILLEQELGHILVQLEENTAKEPVSKYEENLRLVECEIAGQLQTGSEKGQKIHSTEQQLANLMQQSKEAQTQKYAGILAEELSEGMRCPVCGNIVKEVIAHKTEETGVDAGIQELQEKLQELKDEKLTAKIRLEAAVKERGRLLEQITTEQEILESTRRQLQVRCEEKKKELQNLKNIGNLCFADAGKEIVEKDERRIAYEKKARMAEAELDEWNCRLEKQRERFRELKTELEALERLSAEDSSTAEQADKADINDSGFSEIQGYKSEEWNAAFCRTVFEKRKELEQSYQEADSCFRQQELLAKERKNQFLLEEERMSDSLKKAGFQSMEEAKAVFFSAEEMKERRQSLEDYRKRCQNALLQETRLESFLQGRSTSEEEVLDARRNYEKLETEKERLTRVDAALQREIADLEERVSKKKELAEKIAIQQKQMDRVKLLLKLFAGKKFVQYIAAERLSYISSEASEILGEISGGRLGLETDENGNFVIRDYINGGAVRSVFTLSGGETFLVSLSLALALSTHIQLKNEAVLDFFFLDEGFGTLDEELLSEVMEALERLQNKNRTIGLISHVAELQERVPVKLIVSPPEMGGCGSRVQMEIH